MVFHQLGSISDEFQCFPSVFTLVEDLVTNIIAYSNPDLNQSDITLTCTWNLMQGQEKGGRKEGMVLVAASPTLQIQQVALKPYVDTAGCDTDATNDTYIDLRHR